MSVFPCHVFNNALCALALLSLTAIAVSAPSLPPAEDLLPAGAATYRGKLDHRAFAHPSSNLDLDRRLDWHLGSALFDRLWVSAPASTQAADGLGPLYNARACQQCHRNGGRGHAPEQGEHNAVSMVVHLYRSTADDGMQPDPVYGDQLQDLSVAGQRAEYRFDARYGDSEVLLNGGETVHLRQPTILTDSLAYGPLDPATHLSPRVAPQLIGLGLIEAVDASQILALADPEDRNGDGISGRPSLVSDPLSRRQLLGRFGYKATSVDIAQQSQLAFSRDIGISVPAHPAGSGDCTARQPTCLQAPNGNSPQYGNLEADQRVVDLVALYTRHLAVPQRRNVNTPDVVAGEKLFGELGCAACHHPSYQTANDATEPELRDLRIFPYSDLLLHDMGDGLADSGDATAAISREWRTAPLWGIGLTATVSGHYQLLHDGRARSVLEAILWHGGEAQSQRDAVVALTPDQRRALVRFVESL